MQGRKNPTDGTTDWQDEERLSLSLILSVIAHLALLATTFTTPPENMHGQQVTRSPIHATILPIAERPGDPSISVETRLPKKATSSRLMSGNSQKALPSGEETLEFSPPELLDHIELETLESGTDGQLILTVSIDAQGIPRSVSVTGSTLQRDTEGRIVLQFYRARYKPAQRNGHAVNGSYVVEVRLNPEKPADPR